MDSEYLTVEIKGNKALPVRAIPYVTGWGVGELVQYLSREVGAPFERLQEVYGYHLISGQPVKYLPREWESIKINLDALSAELHEKFKNDDQGYAAWCSEAVKILPEGVFVWVDEFEKDCSVNLSPNRIIFNNERDGDRKLNYTPHLTTSIREMVFAGFEEICGKKINQFDIHKPSTLEAAVFTKHTNEKTPQTQVEIDNTSLSELFNAVPVDALEKMFPANGKWKKWCERAARNGLSEARVGRAKFNPYKAAIWFMQYGNEGWDLARCHRVLKNNLPARSKYKADLLEPIDDK